MRSEGHAMAEFLRPPLVWHRKRERAEVSSPVEVLSVIENPLLSVKGLRDTHSLP